MIAGKTESEILAMNLWARCRWYKTILPKEKEEAMRIIKIGMKIKMKGAWTPERRDEQRARMTGKNSPTKRPEVRAKLSLSKMGDKNPMKRLDVISKHKKIMKSQDYRDKLKAGWTPERRIEHSIPRIGKNHWNWQDGKSFEPYCILFDFKKKEEIRNKYGRVCIVCGKSTLQNVSKDKTYWFGRLDIDHVDENKMQGCNNWEWRLVPLCRVCHAKMQDRQTHLLLQLLLINNKLEQINLEVK